MSHGPLPTNHLLLAMEQRTKPGFSDDKVLGIFHQATDPSAYTDKLALTTLTLGPQGGPACVSGIGREGFGGAVVS